MAKLREFEHVMTQVPMMEYEMEQGFQMIALAQHYGMCTDYVDFSGSLFLGVLGNHLLNCTWGRTHIR